MCTREMEAEFKRLLSRFFSCDESRFCDESNFIEEFGIDSLGVLMLICLVEETFGIANGDPSKYYELVTYKKAWEYLCGQYSSQGNKGNNT